MVQRKKRGKPISNIEGAIRFFLGGRGEGKGEVMEKFEIKNKFYNFLCLVISI